MKQTKPGYSQLPIILVIALLSITACSTAPYNESFTFTGIIPPGSR